MNVRNLFKNQLAGCFVLLICPFQLLFAADFDPDLAMDDACQVALCHPDEEALDVFFVDQSAGSDTNTGGIDDPFASIMAAVDLLEPGDSVCIAEGVYEESVVITTSGTAAEPIMFDVLPGSEGDVVIEGNAFEILGASHVTVRGLKVQNANNGFRVRGPADPYGPPAKNIRLINNRTYNTFSSAFSIWGSSFEEDPGNFNSIDGILVEYSHIELANNGGWDEQITVAQGVKNAHIRYNELTNAGEDINGGEGIDFKDGVQDSYIYNNYIHDIKRRAIYVDGGRAQNALTSNIHIFNNRIVDSPSSGIYVMSEGFGNVDGVYIYNNIVNGAKGPGIGVYEHPRGAEHKMWCAWLSLPPCAQIKNIQIINNTVINANSATWRAGIHIDHPDVTGVIRNNISINSYGRPIQVIGGTTEMQVDHNLCDIEDPDCAIVADPKLNWGLKPNPGSPAIDAGSAEGAPETDYSGVVRPQGAGFDIGAVERKQ
jgi:hypothetical protein